MTPERKEEIHVEHELWAAGDRKHHPNGCPECELLAALDEAQEELRAYRASPTYY